MGTDGWTAQRWPRNVINKPYRLKSSVIHFTVPQVHEAYCQPYSIEVQNKGGRGNRENEGTGFHPTEKWVAILTKDPDGKEEI